MAKKQIGIGSIGIQKVFDGVSSYVFIRYSSYANGQDMTDEPDESTAYIGMYTTTTGKASIDPKDYQWLSYKGSDGQDGSSPISAFLTDELITIATDHAGNGGNFDKASTSIVIFEGTQEDTDNWTIRAEASDGIIGNISGDTYKLTSLTKDTGQIIFTATKSANTITKIANVVKIKAGKPGEDGNDGANAKLLYLTSTAETVIIKPDGLVKENQNLYLTAHLQNMNGSVNWDITPYIGEAAQSKLEITPIDNSVTITDKNWNGTWDRVVITATLGGLTDTTTILSLRESKDGVDGVDGVNAISTLLTNESATLAADSEGVISDYSGAIGSFRLYDGTILVESGITYAVASKSNANGTISATGDYKATSLTADTGYLTFQATYKGVKYNKVFNLSKSKAGTNGVPGQNGVDGTTYYTWIKYADTSTPTPEQIVDSPEGQTYMGIAINQTTQSESTDYRKYKWSLIKGADGSDGADGVPGTDGVDGTTYYTWVRYAPSKTPTSEQITSDPTGTDYIGIAYNKESNTPSKTPEDYTWSLYKGADGSDGENAKLLYLSASSDVMQFDSADKALPGQSITITANLQNVSGNAVFTATPYIEDVAQSPITLSGTGNVRTLTGEEWNKTWTKVICVAQLNKLVDTKTIVKIKEVRDGVDGANGTDGLPGKDGSDAVLLTVSSVNGNMFKNTGVSTILTAVITVGGAIIDTAVKMHDYFGADCYLQWQIKKIGELEFTDIPLDDRRLSDEGFMLTVNVDDVDQKATFKCDLYY